MYQIYVQIGKKKKKNEYLRTTPDILLNISILLQMRKYCLFSLYVSLNSSHS